MTITTKSPEDKKDEREQSVVPLLAAVIGSVAGTLVTTAMSSSQDMALLGAALGAAIPPLVAVVGPYTHLRLGAGVLIAGLALLLTYGGFTITDKAAGRETTTFPVPGDDATRRADPAPQALPSPSPTPPSPSPAPSTPKATCEGDLCINWGPRRLQCSNDSCESIVTVWSEGSERLRVTSLEFDGDAAGRLSHSGDCEDNTWDSASDKPCIIAIQVAPGEGETAQLVIHQNLKGPPSFVDIEIGAAGPSTSSPSDNTLDLEVSGVSGCTVVPQGSVSGADALTVFVAIRHSGPLPLSRLVPFSITSDSGHAGGGNTSVSNQGSTPAQVDLRPDDYGGEHRFTITIDPSNEVPERDDESNNSVSIVVRLPDAVSQPQDVDC